MKNTFKSTYRIDYAPKEDSAIFGVSDNLPSVYALRYTKCGKTVAILHFAEDSEYEQPCYLLTVEGTSGFQEAFAYDAVAFPNMLVNLQFHNDIAIAHLNSIGIKFDTIVVHDHRYGYQRIVNGVLS